MRLLTVLILCAAIAAAAPSQKASKLPHNPIVKPKANAAVADQEGPREPDIFMVRTGVT